MQRETGFYWVRSGEDWFVRFFDKESGLWYLPAIEDGFEDSVYAEITSLKELEDIVGGRLSIKISAPLKVKKAVNPWQDFMDEHCAWADAKFGTDPLERVPGNMKHIKRECDEVIANPGDVSEYADIFMINLHTFHCQFPDKTMDDFLAACREKLEICKARPAWKQDEDGVINHVRESDK